MRRLLFALAFCIASICAFSAEPDSYEFWPELDVFYRLSRTERLYFMLAPTRERDVGLRDIQVGANIEFGLAPFIRGLPDSTQSESWAFRYLRLRTGVRYFFGVDPEFPFQEWRGVIELTPILPMGNWGTLYLRNRVDLRWVSGTFSLRPRFRLMYENRFSPFGTGNVSLTPFASVELNLDSRTSGISRMRYQAGLSFGVTSFLSLDPSFVYQQNIYPTEQSVFAPGINCVVYF